MAYKTHAKEILLHNSTCNFTDVQTADPLVELLRMFTLTTTQTTQHKNSSLSFGMKQITLSSIVSLFKYASIMRLNITATYIHFARKLSRRT